MKRLFLLVFAATMLSCDSRTVQYEDVHQENNLVYVLGEKEPFTGKVNFHPDEDGYTQLEVYDGKVAKTLRYYPNGKPRYVRRGYDGEYLVFYDETGKSIAPKDYFNVQEKLHLEELRLQAVSDSIRISDSIAAVEAASMEIEIGSRQQEGGSLKLDLSSLNITEQTYARRKQQEEQKAKIVPSKEQTQSSSIEELKKSGLRMKTSTKHGSFKADADEYMVDDSSIKVEAYCIYYEDNSFDAVVNKVYDLGSWRDVKLPVTPLVEADPIEYGVIGIRKAYEAGYRGLFRYKEKVYLL